MSFHGPFVLVSVAITTAMMSSCTIAEPDTGETAWVSGGTYAVGDVRIRATTHRKYACILAHTGRTVPPETDYLYWKDLEPTNRWAMLDARVSTQSTATGSMTVVLQPGFFNAIALYKLSGTSIDVTVKDAPGGSVIYHYAGDLYEPFSDLYEWLFAPYKPLTKLVLRDIVPYDTAEVTITVTGGVSDTVGIGMICIGDLRPMVVSGEIGGSQYGCRVEPVDYSYVKTDEFGETSIVKRKSTTDLRFSVFLPNEDADYATNLLQEVLSIPAAWIVIDASGYAALNAFGLGSGSVEYAGPSHAICEVSVKGLI